MRKIDKGREPKEWIEKKCTPGVDYNAIPELKNALLDEQGYLCAYCMQRISEDTMKVEHIKPRSKNKELNFEYKNLVACCKGGEGYSEDRQHCDTKKGNTEISIDVFNDDDIKTISYSSRTGEIKSSSTEYNKDINDILNLNCSYLKRQRISVLNAAIEALGKNLDWKNSRIKKEYDKYLNKDKEGKYKPYCGIVLWFLGRKFAKQK
ncbi:MAG: retron system putative HNH endonuclease [Candidatus Onthomorpha sp.]|nr:retron system putative HNH endonuclease [Candidatus Onthomorpha sp.]